VILEEAAVRCFSTLVQLPTKPRPTRRSLLVSYSQYCDEGLVNEVGEIVDHTSLHSVPPKADQRYVCAQSSRFCQCRGTELHAHPYNRVAEY